VPSILETGKGQPMELCDTVSHADGAWRGYCNETAKGANIPSNTDINTGSRNNVWRCSVTRGGFPGANKSAAHRTQPLRGVFTYVRGL